MKMGTRAEGAGAETGVGVGRGGVSAVKFQFFSSEVSLSLDVGGARACVEAAVCPLGTHTASMTYAVSPSSTGASPRHSMRVANHMVPSPDVVAADLRRILIARLVCPLQRLGCASKQLLPYVP